MSARHLRPLSPIGRRRGTRRAKRKLRALVYDILPLEEGVGKRGLVYNVLPLEEGVGKRGLVYDVLPLEEGVGKRGLK